MVNVGIVKSKNLNYEKIPVGGVFLVDFLNLVSGLDLSRFFDIVFGVIVVEARARPRSKMFRRIYII